MDAGLPDMPGQVLTASEAQGARRVVCAVEALRLLLLSRLVSVDAAFRMISALVRPVHIYVLAIWFVLCQGGGRRKRLCWSWFLGGQGAKGSSSRRGRLVHASRGMRLGDGTRARSRGRCVLATLTAFCRGKRQHLYAGGGKVGGSG